MEGIVRIKLENLQRKTGYNIVQHNGQRRFGPPANWVGPPPPRGCEVFIGKLPRDIYEDELVPVFSSVGTIYELRLMMDFSGSNRGYGFVVYSDKSEAIRAIKELNGYQIRPGRHIGVVKSVDNCRLYIGGIPKMKTKEEILNELKKLVSGIVDVIVYKNCYKTNLNRGFAFVEFATHRAAAMARRSLVPGISRLFDREVIVDWAEPEPYIDDEKMKEVKVLYARNFSISTTPEDIKKVFEDAINTTLERVKKIYDYAFIHFFERSHAEQALSKLQNLVLDGNNIEVVWSRPVDRKMYKILKLCKGNAKFINFKDYSDVLLMYKHHIQTNQCDLTVDDEGMSSPDAVMCSYNMNQTMPQKQSEDTKRTAVGQLEDMCTSYKWDQPMYVCKTFSCSNAYQGYICYLDLPNVGPPLLPRLYNIGTFKSKLSFTFQQAKEEVAEQALNYFKQINMCAVPCPTPGPMQNFYQNPIVPNGNLFHAPGYNYFNSHNIMYSVPVTVPYFQ